MIGWIKKNLMLVIVVAAVLGSISFYVGIKVADQPWFCGLACHEMDPHYESLKANFHGKNGVVCMDCHSYQGFFHHAEEHILASGLVVPHITKVYLNDHHSNFHANVPDFDMEGWDFKGKTIREQREIFKQCRRCHQNRLDKSYFMFMPKGEKDEMVTSNCKRCHPAVAKQAEEDTEKAKEALYKEGKNAPNKMPNVHPLHLGMDVYCNTCHNRVVHNNNPETSPMAMGDCTTCHDGENAPFEDCKMCHVGIKKIFDGNTGRGIEETASVMQDIECLDCHNSQRQYTVSSQACVDCHEDDSYGKPMIDDWQGVYNEKLALATKAYEKAKVNLKEADRKGKDVSGIVSVFKDGEYNYNLALIDGSHGVHNAEFTTPLLENAAKTFAEVNNMIEISLAP